MQATSPSYHPAIGTGWLTTTSLILIVAFAAITLAAIFYGMRQSARRRDARRIEEARVDQESGQGTTATPEPPVQAPVAPLAREPIVTPPLLPVAAPAPVAPSPPPLDPGPVVGTPAADPLPASPAVTDEPVAAAAPFDASPAAEAEPAPAESAGPSLADRPVTRLKGLGPKVAARLRELGIETVGDLAALDDAQAESVDARLGPFTGRMARDRWIEQARLLASGDERAFEATFGKL